MSPRILSLFSGYGGLDMGVIEALGGEVIAHSEIEPSAVKILNHRWPDVPQLGDITTADLSGLAQVDIVTGGFPCQDVSSAGRQAGLIRNGEGRTRSGLWGVMANVIDKVRPRLVVAENVRGLLSAGADSDVESCPWCVGDGNGGGRVPMRALGAVLADLADIGYDAGWYGLPASDVGACHQRFRVFIVARPTGSRDTWAVRDAANAEGVEQREPQLTGVPAGDRGSGDGYLLPTPRVTDGHGAGEHGQGGHDLRTTVTMLPTPRATDGTHGGPNQRGSKGDLTLPSATALLPTPSVAMYPSNRSGSPNAARRPSLYGPVRWGQYESAIRHAEAAFGHPAPPAVSPTARDGRHRLNPAFVEWMMMLPAGHVTDVPGVARTRQLGILGNGVVPPQAAAAIRRIMLSTGWGVAA